MNQATLSFLSVVVSAILLFFAGAGPALAWLVTVDGTTYNVSVERTSYTDSATLLQSQDWWGDGDPGLARDIANQMFFDDVDLIDETGGDAFGVYFGFEEDGSNVNTVFYQMLNPGGTPGNRLPSVNSFPQGVSQSNTVPYAIATIVPEINGGSLASFLLILTAGLLGLFSMRDRRRKGRTRHA